MAKTDARRQFIGVDGPILVRGDRPAGREQVCPPGGARSSAPVVGALRGDVRAIARGGRARSPITRRSRHPSSFLVGGRQAESEHLPARRSNPRSDYRRPVRWPPCDAQDRRAASSFLGDDGPIVLLRRGRHLQPRASIARPAEQSARRLAPPCAVTSMRWRRGARASPGASAITAPSVLPHRGRHLQAESEHLRPTSKEPRADRGHAAR